MIFTPDERKALMALAGLLCLGLAARWIMPSGPEPAGGGDSLLVQLARRPPAVADTPPPPGFREEGKVRINDADAADLERLPGIGPALAQRIVEARARLGGFQSETDLRKVRGIGPKTASRLAELISFASRADADSGSTRADCTRNPHAATQPDPSRGDGIRATPAP